MFKNIKQQKPKAKTTKKCLLIKRKKQHHTTFSSGSQHFISKTTKKYYHDIWHMDEYTLNICSRFEQCFDFTDLCSNAYFLMISQLMLPFFS